MKRRKFINKTALSLAFLSSIAACGDKEEVNPIASDKKIVIIGAGIAGLSAAKYFKDRGINVTIIEAQEKVGGRIRTDRSLGIAFDEGASWIHGSDKDNPLIELANAAGANTFFTDDDNITVFDIDGSAYADSLLDREEKEYDKILDAINGNINESFQSVFYNKYPQYQDNRLWTYMLSTFLEFDSGGDIEALSSLDIFDDEAFKGDDLIITDGYDKIADYLATGIDIQLNTKVSAIDYGRELIQVSTSQAMYEADFVLVTVPLGILKQNIISFTPTLSNGIEAAINGLEMGSINKFLCVWDTPFWDTDLQYIGYTPEAKGKFNYFLNATKFTAANALMTFTFGDYSKKTESMSDAEVVADIMIHLKVIYGNDIPDPTNILRTKWVSNEYTFGSYSFVTNGTRTSLFEEFEKEIDNKLFFAGEHTSKDYRGTVHGAYLSGIREAEKMAKLL